MKNETFFLDYLFVPFCTHVNEIAFDTVANSTELFCTFCPKSGFTEEFIYLFGYLFTNIKLRFSLQLREQHVALLLRNRNSYPAKR